MSTLNRKLLRDLWRSRGQVIAIALVIAAGVATVVMSLGTLHSLVETRAAFYDRYRFADVFAHAKRAPEHVVARIAEIPGVTTVQTRIAHDVILDVEGMDEPARARILSLPDTGEPALNAVVVRIGRGLEPHQSDEVLVSEAFAEAHGFVPGDSIFANLNGKRRELRIVGIVLSPEFVYAIGPGQLVPDDERFGILWMGREALEAAFDLEGAFNDVSLGLSRDATEAEVIDRVDEILAPYGGIGAYGRRDHVSDSFLRSEFEQLEAMTGVVPPIFLAVAAFLLNLVINRLVETEREQIGLLKAFGYSDFSVGAHYMRFALVVVALGIALGWLFGAWIGRGMTSLYTTYYRFPFLYYIVDTAVFAGAALVSLAAAGGGALLAVRRAVRLPPAVAMQPPAPTHYHRSVTERLGVMARLRPPTRMIFRHIARWPLRSAFTALGISFSVALLVSSLFFLDAIDWMIDDFFFRSQRHDVELGFVEARGAESEHDVAHLPGVIEAEGYRSVPARLRHGPRERRVALTGLSAGAELTRLVDDRGAAIEIPPSGLVLTSRLAQLLDAREGDTVLLEALEGRRPQSEARVEAVVEQSVGMSAYMDRLELSRLMTETPSVSGMYLRVDSAREPELFRAVKRAPLVQAVTAQRAALEKFRALIDQTMTTMILFYVLFASLIAIGVIYNGARIALSERARELASLRVLGFYRGEVMMILLGELTILTLAALPFGCLLGYGLAAFMVSSFDSDLFRLPLVVESSTYGFSVLVVLIASLVTGLLVARRVSDLDLVAVLKTRE